MYAKKCKEYKEMQIWKEELCKWCTSSCRERHYDYDLAGGRWSLKRGGRKPTTKRSTGMELGSVDVESKGEVIP